MKLWQWCRLSILVSACASAPQAQPASAPRGVSAAPEATLVDERPVPPADLDARLVIHYPLRGLVLSESGMARVRFTVEPSGAVITNDVLYETSPEYSAACRRMLEGTIWTPARAGGGAARFASSFDCRFEHGGANQARTTAPPAITVPPVSPDYGQLWWEKYGLSYLGEDIGAQLRIIVGVDGRVTVDSVLDGSDPELASVCKRLLLEGPAWTPAKDTSGAPVPSHVNYHCIVDVKGALPSSRLSMKGVGASGPLGPELIATKAAEHMDAVSACFKSTIAVDNRALGRHWLAFEILPQGDVGRVEWVERLYNDAQSSACLITALQKWRFPIAAERTIADIDFYLGSGAN